MFGRVFDSLPPDLFAPADIKDSLSLLQKEFDDTSKQCDAEYARYEAKKMLHDARKAEKRSQDLDDDTSSSDEENDPDTCADETIMEDRQMDTTMVWEEDALAMHSHCYEAELP